MDRLLRFGLTLWVEHRQQLEHHFRISCPLWHGWPLEWSVELDLGCTLVLAKKVTLPQLAHCKNILPLKRKSLVGPTALHLISRSHAAK